MRGLILAGVLLAVSLTWAAAGAAPDEPSSQDGSSHALILVGLPGDAAHDRLFAAVAGQWRDWLTNRLGFPPANVRILFGKDGKPDLARGPATQEAIGQEVAGLKEALRPEDRLWVFCLGHGDYDGERASFHVPGPDLHGDDLHKLFAEVRCREQVFWMTTSASGWFLKPLSAKGRIVITATAADDEYNETEFPHALATVAQLPPDKLDANRDGKVSVLEVYRRTVAEVESRFAADKRAATEHAQLDDNGDGAGTEEPVVEGEGKKATADGALAARTFLPVKAKSKE
jgi:hypothetical protein